MRKVLTSYIGLALMITMSMTPMACTTEIPIVDESNLNVEGATYYEVASEGQQLTIAIDAAGTWNSISQHEWITTLPQEKGLKVIVAPNATGQTREGAVLLVSGNLRRKITIRQDGTALQLQSEADALEVGRWAGSYVIPFTANHDQWTLESDAEWLTVVGNAARRQFTLTLEANETDAPRHAKIYIRDAQGQLVRDFTVTQRGYALHMLPAYDFLEPIASVLRFEEERHSTLAFMPSNANETEYAVGVESTLFSGIVYNTFDSKYTTASLVARAANYFNNESARRQQANFLLDNGYEAVEGKPLTFWNPTQRIEALIDNKSVQHKVVFTYVPEQPQSYEIPAAVPIVIPEGIDPKLPSSQLMEQILELEMAQGNEVDEELLESFESADYSVLRFTIAEPEEGGPEFRAYFLNMNPEASPGLLSISYYYRQTEPYFFYYKGVPYPTRELDEMARREGYAPFRRWTDRVMYTHPERKEYLIVNIGPIAKQEGNFLGVMRQFYK